ncbi:MAG: DUF192 domain-containing protein [Caldilineaceae bacterium]|nr:DUF192 domain-containing protein [Caldilineaceae bacterium]
MLQVENKTRNVTLVSKGRLANNFWKRLRGLVGVKELAAGDGMLIQPCNQVHCMFMSIPIDVIYIGSDQRVLAIDAAMRPWAMGRMVRGAKRVLELPAGTAAATETKVGDQLQITL